MLNKIKQLAEKIELQKITRLRLQGLGCEANIINVKTTVKEGKKYIKINVGHSGFLMIDKEGNIFGIKGYGVIHRGHHYGNLDTISEYNWGDYTPRKI